MAFVDLSNFKDWPMGGMLEYELAILPYLCEHYDVDIYGYSVDGIAPKALTVNNELYPIRICGNCCTKGKIIPNFYKGILTMFNGKLGKYDVIYAHTGSCLVGAKFVVSKNTKLVYHQHGLNYQKDFSLMSLIQRPFYNLAQKYADAICVVSDSESVSNYAKHKRPNEVNKYLAIGSPVELSKFDLEKIKSRIETRKKNNAKYFLYTGRLTAFKNVKVLVKAFALYVKNIMPDAVFTIAGTGEEYDIIQQLSKEFGIQENIRLLGFVPHSDIYNLLLEADVFLTASGGEGWSVSVLEAYASGLPLVCGKVPGLEKQVLNGVTGLFVDDISPEGFYDKMKEINDIRYTLALNCIEKSKQFDAKLIANKIIQKIDSLF